MRAIELHRTGGDLDAVRALFSEALAYRTFGDTEVREQLGNIAQDVVGEERHEEGKRRAFISFAVEEMRKETVKPARDVKHMIFLAVILGRAKNLNPDYFQEAEKLLLDAMRLSPAKQILYFELGALYIQNGKYEEAVPVLQKSADLDRSNYKANFNLMVAAMSTGNIALANEARDRLDITVLNEGEMRTIARITEAQADLEFGEKLYREMTRRYAPRAEYHAKLSAILGEREKFDEAIAAAERAAARDESYAAEAKMFIKIMEQRKRNAR